jgi:hypothetical protein
VGLKRHDFSKETLQKLRRAYRLLFQSGLNTSEGMARVEEEVRDCPEVREWKRKSGTVPKSRTSCNSSNSPSGGSHDEVTRSHQPATRQESTLLTAPPNTADPNLLRFCQ